MVTKSEYWKNPEKHRANSQRYRAEHKEKIKEYNKKWTEANREKKNAYARKYYEEHKDHCLEYQREYKRNHKDQNAAACRRWRKKNPEKLLEIKYRSETKRILKDHAEEMASDPEHLETDFIVSLLPVFKCERSHVTG